MKRAILTIDVEEFADILCLSDLDTSSLPSAMDGFDYFLSTCESVGAKAVLFCLADAIGRDKERLLDAVSRGHEIGLHGLHHDLPTSLSLEEFKRQCAEGKAILESNLNTRVSAYRAPAFNLKEEELNALPGLGFRFDVSKQDVGKRYIDYGEHVEAVDFEQLSDHLYRKGDFYEVAMPIAPNTLFKGFPLGGGVLPRFWKGRHFFKALRKYLKENDTFVFYCHPFEFSNAPKIKLKGTHPHERFYCNRQRPGYRETFEKVLSILKEEGFVFSTLEDLVSDASKRPF